MDRKASAGDKGMQHGVSTTELFGQTPLVRNHRTEDLLNDQSSVEFHVRGEGGNAIGTNDFRMRSSMTHSWPRQLAKGPLQFPEELR